MPAPLLVVDAPGLLYRAFFALPDSIRDSDGAPVNALLGSTNAILAVVETYAPRAVVACFGQESAEYRVQAYPSYHAARPPMPAPLQDQFAAAPELYRALNWACSTHATLEADDLLHSLALSEAEAGGRALVLTGDRDLFQSARPDVTILLTRPRQEGVEEIGPDDVRRLYGVPPEAVPDFIALRGDPSDGLPGARGIGAKTAADLLRRHGTLAAALAAALRESPAVRRALVEQREELERFRDIATLRRVRLARPPDAPTDHVAGADAARRLGLRRLAERLERKVSASAS